MAYTIELPGAYLDALVLDEDSTGIVFADRMPGPGDTGFPAAPGSYSGIIFWLYDIDGGAVVGGAGESVQIYFNDVLVYNNGYISNPYIATVSPASYLGDSLGRYAVTPGATFTSEQVLTLRVVALSSAGASFDQSYSFTVEDLTAPTISSAVATGHKTVRVIFSESVLQTDAANANDALNPANYAITPTDTPNTPAVTPVVLSVAAYTSSSVELTTDIELSQGAPYRITALNLEDRADNEIAAPLNTADFTAYRCATPLERAFDLWKMVPRKSRTDDTTGDLGRGASDADRVRPLALPRRQVGRDSRPRPRPRKLRGRDARRLGQPV